MSQEPQRGREWDIRKDENPRFYQLFMTYAKLPMDRRNLRELARVTKLSYDHLAALSARFKWTSRADQREAWIFKQKERAEERAIVSRAEQEAQTVWALGDASLILAQRFLEKVKSTPKTIPVLDRKGEPVMDTTTGLAKTRENPEWVLSAGSIVELVESSIKLARLIRDEPGSIDELGRRRARDEMLARLQKIAEDLAPVPEEEGKS